MKEEKSSFCVIIKLGDNNMPAARIHEVIALKVNKEYKCDETLLRIGTISPDSWRNSEILKNNNGKNITHFINTDIKDVKVYDYVRFFNKYKDDIYNPFYFGYLIHLMVDQYWKTKIDPKYCFKEDGVDKCRLRDGSIVVDEHHFSYYEDEKIQRMLAKKYNLDLLPADPNTIPNFECSIEELDLNGLFGPSGTISFVNSRLMPNGNDEESTLYDFDDIDKYTDETASFVEQELSKLLSLLQTEDRLHKM